MNQSDKILIQLRRSLLYALAILVVTSAVALSIARVILPQAQGYREAIQQKLGALIEQKVTIDSIDARLIGLTPTLIFKGVHLLDDSGKHELIAFSEAHLGIAVFQSIAQKNLVPSDFSIVGTTISVLQSEDGNFSVQGLDVTGLTDTKGFDEKISKELASWLMEQASISIKKSTVLLKLHQDNNLYRFNEVNLSLHNRGERHQLSCSVQLPEHAGKQLELNMDVSGDLLKPEKWQGLVYLHSNELKLAAFGIKPKFRELQVKGGKSEFTLWGEWSNGGFTNLAGRVALYGAEVSNVKTNKLTNIDRLKGRFDWQGATDDWQLKLGGLEFVRGDSVWKESSITAGWKKDDKTGSSFELGVAYAKIEDVKQLLLESNLYNNKTVDLIKQMSPRGEVRNLTVRVATNDDAKQKFSVTADISRFGFESTDKIPGLYGVNAFVNLNESSGYISVDGKDVLFTYPKLFRQSIAFEMLAARVELNSSSTGWLLETNYFDLKNKDVTVSAGALMFLPANSKSNYIDMQLALKDVDITRMKAYQPTALMKEKLVKWIDESFIAGRVPDASMTYRGWSSRFPFRKYDGVLNGGFHAVNVTMQYFPGWPVLEGLEAKGEFTNKAITVKSLKSSIHGGDIQNLVVSIDDFKQPILVASGDAYSTTHDGFHFFSKTPVGVRAKRFVSQTRFAGNIHTNMTFSIALDKELAKKYKKRFSGYVETSDSELHMMRNRMDVTDIKGRVYFSDQKHHGEGITAKLLQGDTKISVSSKIVGVKPVMMISGEGSFDAVMLDRRFQKLGLMRLYGRIPWQGQMTLGHQKADSDEREPAKMWIKSDLVGVEIDLPEPFKKSAEIARPSIMHSTFLPDIKTILNIQYGDRMSTEMRLNNNYFPARIEIGEMKLSAGKAKLPEKDEFRLSGVVSNADQYTWREVMQEHYDKYHKLRTRPIVDVPVMVDFAYVGVPFDKEKAKPRKRYTSPIIMPAFKGQVRQFVFAGKNFGKVEFDSRKDKYGLAFDKLRVSSPDMEFDGTLTWHYLNNWHKTKTRGNFTIRNLGNLVTKFGFADKAEDGEGKIDIDLNWDNPFYVFVPGYTDGKVKIALEDGVVSAINPGAGRFLGLLNISTLPRRLLLDFKDAGSGFAYDSLTGSVELKNGIAKTTDLAIDSTVADVLAVGKVDLRKKELDQIVTVTPQIAGTMPVVSGLLMGTGVIPLVWLFERLFGSDMDKSLSRQYHISGPWDKPEVERIDKADDEQVSAQ